MGTLQQREREKRNKIIKFKNGDIHEGQVGNDGLPHGKGTLKTSSGIYEGEFKNGKKEGKAVVRSADGDVYEGEFKNGK